MKSKKNNLELIIELKIKAEQAIYEAEGIKRDLEFDIKDLNSALVSINENSDRKEEFVSNAKSNLRQSINQDIPNRINGLKSILSNMKRKL